MPMRATEGGVLIVGRCGRGSSIISATTLELEEPVGRRSDTENGRKFASGILEVVGGHEVGALEEVGKAPKDVGGREGEPGRH